MKKWMIIAVAMILAGCGDVSVEDTAKTASNPSPNPSGGCQTDDDCAGNTVDKRCDTSRHACVQCTEHAQCDSNACTEGKCETAVCEEDCKNKKLVCDANTRECVECLVDGDCAEHENGQFCDQSQKACVECVKNEDCGGGKICTKNGQCQKLDCEISEKRCEAREDGKFYLYAQCKDEMIKPIDLGCECDGPQETECSKNDECLDNEYVPRCVDTHTIVYACLHPNASEPNVVMSCGEMYCNDENTENVQCVECIDGDESRSCQNGGVCIHNRCELMDEYEFECVDDHELSIKHSGSVIGNISCIDGCEMVEGKGHCVEHRAQLCSVYTMQCNSDGTALDLVCSEDTGLIKESVMVCADGEICNKEKNQCEPKPFEPYECTDTEKVNAEIRVALDELGIYDDSVYEECKNNVIYNSDLQNKSDKSSCIVLCGEFTLNNQGFNGVNNLFNGNKNNYLIGVDNATIKTKSSAALTKPLFNADLEATVIHNITLDYDLKVSGSNNGMLARSVKNNSVISKIRVPKHSVYYESKNQMSNF